MIKNKLSVILGELESVLSKIDNAQINCLIETIIKKRRIVVIGVGRVGLAAKSFAMRLMHLGMESYTMNDCNLPSLTFRDLLIVCSGSGETQTIYDLTLIAKQAKVKIVTFTGNINSRIAKLSDLIIEIKAPNKCGDFGIKSIQPMTTLMEQSMFLLFDAVVLELMQRMKITGDLMKKRHSILE